MEGKSSSSNPPKPTDSLLHKIKSITRSILVNLINGRSPVIVINKFKTYCSHSHSNSNSNSPPDKCCCRSNLPVGKEVLTLHKQSHAYRIDVMLRVLVIVQKLLQEKRHASKRDIYYMWPSLFKEQSVVDRAINDLCILLECSRHNLNVVSVSNGLVMGWIRYFEDGKKVDCMASPNNAQTIPVHVEGVLDVLSFAEYILVVEKESAVFQRLANDQFCSHNRCIVITGRGYPDIPTRRFLRLLTEQLRVPVYCLVDSDPYGFDILTTYRFGSLEMAYDAELLRIPEICWLGAFLSDTEKYDIPSCCLLPLTTEDKKKTEAMLGRCYLLHEEPQWRLELEVMLEKGVKFEIEALSAGSLSFLSKEYLPSKIRLHYSRDRDAFGIFPRMCSAGFKFMQLTSDQMKFCSIRHILDIVQYQFDIDLTVITSWGGPVMEELFYV